MTQPSRLHRSALPLALVGLVLLCFAGPVVADSFEYAEDELPYSLNPLHESSMAETRLNELLFEGLWGPGYDAIPEPRLADAYELSADGMVMTIYLKEGLLWSDGEPITADDVEFTVKAYMNPKTHSPDRGRVSFIRSAKSVDATTVRLEFNEPESEPIEKLYFKILPRHRFDSPAVSKTHPFWYQPATSGPFKLSRQDLGTWTLEANLEASRSPTIGEVKVREMPDKNQQVSSLGYGYIQAMINVPAQYLPEVERSRNSDLIPYQSKAWWYIGMNEKNTHLKKLGVRNALARAIDLDEALALVGEGYRISGPFVPSSKFYNHSPTVAVLGQDLLEASALMEAEGYRVVDGGWTRKGKPVQLRIFYRTGLGDQGQTVALNLQSQLRRFGIDATDPVSMDKAVWNEKVFGERDYDLVVDSWSFDKNENIYDLFHSKGTQNYVHYSNKGVDSVLDKGFAETDPAAKVAYMHEAHRLLAQDLPYVFLWSLRSYTAVRRDVEGVFVQPFYYFSQFSDWRLPDRD